MKTPISPDGEILLYHLAGQMTVNWSLVESALTIWCAEIYQRAGGRHLSKELPRMFRRKTDFLTKCMNRLSWPEETRQIGLGLLRAAKALAAVRHDLTHGVIAGYNDSTRTFTFMRIDVAKNKSVHVVSPISYTADALAHACEKTQELATDTLSFNRHIMELIKVDDETDKALRELSV